MRTELAGHRLHYGFGDSTLGTVLVAAGEDGIKAIFLGAAPAPLLAELQVCFPRAELVAGTGEFDASMAKVVRLVEHPSAPADLPLAPAGTPFQRQVWTALMKVPVGTTRSYSELAVLAGTPGAVRAVASACASNRLAVAVPCHRIVRRDGSAGGYRWGFERKLALLAREQRG